VDNGDLLIEGDAVGAIEIVDLGDGTLQVTQHAAAEDGGDLVQIFDGVNDDIRIAVDSGEVDFADAIAIDLSANSVALDRIYADLGSGDNSLSLVGGAIGGNFVVKTGNGDDAISIAEGVSIQGGVYLALRDGDNTTTLGGKISRDLAISGGVDDDTITLLAESLVGRSVAISAGAGTNSVVVAGTIAGNLHVVSSNSDDTVDISSEATIVGTTNLGLGQQTEHARRHRGHGFRGRC
jgi:hypothetical protein